MKINLNFEYNPSRICSEFYQNSIIYAETEECILDILAYGHITLQFEEDECKFKDTNASSELWKRDFTDKDLQRLQDEGLVYENNWFEYIIEFKDNRETIYCNDILSNIDECLEILNIFIKKEYDKL